MEGLELLIDLHKDNERQGPGSEASCIKALELSGLLEKQQESEQLKVADLGCGTGFSSIFLAKNLNAEIYSVDFLPDFLNILEKNAKKANVLDKIQTFARSMDDLPFQKEYFDAIWSEGAIYNIGFEKGVEYFKNFLKKDGILALSEITWLTNERPEELTNYWVTNYPEIDTASAKMAILEKLGFTPIGYFTLPVVDWLNSYYAPLEAKHNAFIEKHGNAGQEIVNAEKEEIAFYKKYSDYYSYGFYIAVKK